MKYNEQYLSSEYVLVSADGDGDRKIDEWRFHYKEWGRLGTCEGMSRNNTVSEVSVG